jgi:two-component system nitrate/nitrite response regulator NarL
MPARILIADDDTVFGEAIAAYLEQTGHRTSWVPDADGVIRALSEQRYDILITDITMPGNEQMELLEALREAPYPVPVIVVTGTPSLTTAVASLRKDAVDYLTKPLDYPALGRAVDRAIDRRKTVDAVVKAREQLDDWSSMIRSLHESLAPQVAQPEPKAGAPSDPLAALPEAQRALLSPRETEVLLALATGASTRELSAQLFISEHTVRNHLKAIYRKLGVHSRTELFSKLTAWAALA